MADIRKIATSMEVESRTDPGLMRVGGVAGLYLQVERTGSKSWILRATVGSKRRDIGLGGYPDVSLSEARKTAQELRKRISQGIDPVAERKAARAALIQSQTNSLTFRQATASFLTMRGDEWRNAKHRQQWANTLETYAFPIMGDLPVQDITKDHVLRTLDPIWKTKTTTAKRVRGRIESVLDWATTRGYREGLNPARWKGHLDTLLATPSRIAKVEHHPALPAAQMYDFMRRLREHEGLGAKALELAILTACRSGEVRGATWGEIDLDGKTWVIPSDRMKAGREHRVPLSDDALNLLRNLHSDDVKPDTLIFPSRKGTALSDMTLTAVMRRMKVEAVPHGFRSTFRDWVAESTNYPHDVAEMALAHTISNKVEAAYRRGDLFEKRRALMNEWARFLNTRPTNAEVIRLNQKRQA